MKKADLFGVGKNGVHPLLIPQVSAGYNKREVVSWEYYHNILVNETGASKLETLYEICDNGQIIT